MTVKSNAFENQEADPPPLPPAFASQIWGSSAPVGCDDDARHLTAMIVKTSFRSDKGSSFAPLGARRRATARQYTVSRM
jgi:hypothetical protein